MSGVSQSQRKFIKKRRINSFKETCDLIKFICYNIIASSRSGSPSSRLSYATYNREGESLIARPRRLSGHGIRSTGNSREPSPQRFGMDRSFASKIRYNIYFVRFV